MNFPEDDALTFPLSGPSAGLGMLSGLVKRAAGSLCFFFREIIKLLEVMDWIMCIFFWVFYSFFIVVVRFVIYCPSQMLMPTTILCRVMYK